MGQDPEYNTRGEMVDLGGRGSLTSSAEEIFFTDIQMKVVNTGSAILDMYFLLISIPVVFNIPLALVRNFVMESILEHRRL